MISVFILFISFCFFFVLAFDFDFTESIPETKDEVPNYFASAVADQRSTRRSYGACRKAGRDELES